MTEFDFWVLVSAIIVNIVLVIVTVTQISIYRNEIKNRVRPWVGRNSEDSGGLKLSDPDEKYKAFKMRVINNGSLPAQNVASESYSHPTKPEQDIFKNTKPKTIVDMLPNESSRFIFPLNDKDYEKARNGVLYFGIRLTYATGSNRNKLNGKYEIHGRWKMNKVIIDRVVIK